MSTATLPARPPKARRSTASTDPRIGRLVDIYLRDIEPVRYPEVDEAFAMRVADAYEAAVHSPYEPDVRRAYDHLRIETLRQFEYVESAGWALRPWQRDGQPYANSHEMRLDVLARRQLYFFTGGDLPSDHPLAELTPLVRGGIRLSFNDLFRAVHDFFGHAWHAFEFGPAGEEGAYLSHRRMFTAHALPAMTTETRGQNCWVNFGPHLRDGSGRLHRPDSPYYTAPRERPYAPQKAVLLPDWGWASRCFE